MTILFILSVAKIVLVIVYFFSRIPINTTFVILTAILFL